MCRGPPKTSGVGPHLLSCVRGGSLVAFLLHMPDLPDFRAPVSAAFAPHLGVGILGWQVLTTMQVLSGFGEDWNSDPHACVVSPLPTEHLPALLQFFETEFHIAPSDLDFLNLLFPSAQCEDCSVFLQALLPGFYSRRIYPPLNLGFIFNNQGKTELLNASYCCGLGNPWIFSPHQRNRNPFLGGAGLWDNRILISLPLWAITLSAWPHISDLFIHN